MAGLVKERPMGAILTTGRPNEARKARLWRAFFCENVSNRRGVTILNITLTAF